MSQFDDIVNLVYTETNRPDLVEQTASAVRASTLKMHKISGNLFYKDQLSTKLMFPSSDYIQTCSTDQLTRFRKLKFIRKWDQNYYASQQNPSVPALPPLSGGLGWITPTEALAPFKIVDVEDLFDDYKLERMDVAYVLGNMLNMKSATQFYAVLIVWYAWPNLGTSDNGVSYKSWIAAEHPYAIVYDASATIYRATGDVESAKDLVAPGRGVLNFEIQSLIADNCTQTGD